MQEIKQLNAITLQEQLYNELATQIKSGKYKPGDRIPPELKLSEIYRVSRVTVRNAIQQLVNEDLLIKKHGKGTYVKTQVYTEEFFSGGSFTDTCLRMKAKPSTQIIESTVCHDEAEINAIFGTTAPLIRIKRVRLVDDVPCIVEVDFFPDSFQFLLKKKLEKTSLLHLVTKETGMHPAKFEDYFKIIFATKEFAKQLNCIVGTPLLEVTQTVLTPDNSIIYVNKQYILTTKYIYAVRSFK